jgi:hypothetical protein
MDTIQVRIYRPDSEWLLRMQLAMAEQRGGRLPSVADAVHELIEREEARNV